MLVYLLFGNPGFNLESLIAIHSLPRQTQVPIFAIIPFWVGE